MPQQITPSSSASAPAPQLTAAVYYPKHVFVESVTDLLRQHAGVRLADPNALWGDAQVDGMHLQLFTVLEAGDLEWVAADARANAAWDGLVEPVLSAQVCHVVVQIDGITDARVAQDLLSRVLMVLTRISDDCAVHLPHQQLATTGVLYLMAWDQSGEGAKVFTWFGTLAMWRDDRHTESMAITRGLRAMGQPEVQFASGMEPVETRRALRAIVGSMLTQNAPFVPGLEFELGGTPFTLAAQADPFAGAPALAMVRRDG